MDVRLRLGGSGNASMQHGISGHQLNFTQKSSFTTRQYILGIYMVYTMHIPCGSHVLAFLVAHPRLEASDRDFRRIFSVLDTERPPTRGWGRPKFHNQVLILQTWLPLREVGTAPSAQPYSKASSCRLLYLCGILVVEVAFPSRKHGMSGTLREKLQHGMAATIHVLNWWMLPRRIGSLS